MFFFFLLYIKILQHDFLSPTHSRTSSSASSTGISFTNSSNSNKTTPTQSNKSSPVHSREGSLTTSPSSRNGCHIKQSSFENEKNDFNHNNLVNKYNGINKTMTLPRYQVKLIESKLNVDENDNNCFEKINGNLIEDSVYGSILSTSKKKASENGFEYKTLDGSVIKSVLPPGKGLTLNYKVGALFVLFIYVVLKFPKNLHFNIVCRFLLKLFFFLHSYLHNLSN